MPAPRIASTPREVFLSHSHTDRRFVNKLIAVLRRHGVAFWYSSSHVVGAQQWHDEIGRALSRCDWFIVVLSPASVKSAWVKHELTYALNHERYEGRIVPVLLRPCKFEALSWTLPSLQIVDFTRDFAAGCQALFRVWRLEYDKRSKKGVRRHKR